ncbi:phage tail terminator protein [Vibrio sp. 1982]|uniref:phage tail terminator protein n=1 Tax=Vibrio sp. 1982 TaxID=3074586 RepID=UPI002963EFC3|nr:phage tail terminator protein [Vibrio sp. 1982]MDW2216209.1 phage tail terminator protein [Vibrio sp. 1982]
MEINTVIRESVKTHLETKIPAGMVEHFFDTWLMIDADEETPAVMVYLDDGDLSTEYLDQGEQYDGVLVVSIYLGKSTHDKDLDAIGEEVKKAMPLGFRIPSIARFYRTGFQYERSDTGAYRALHLNHSYKWE